MKTEWQVQSIPGCQLDWPDEGGAVPSSRPRLRFRARVPPRAARDGAEGGHYGEIRSNLCAGGHSNRMLESMDRRGVQLEFDYGPSRRCGGQAGQPSGGGGGCSMEADPEMGLAGNKLTCDSERSHDDERSRRPQGQHARGPPPPRRRLKLRPSFPPRFRLSGSARGPFGMERAAGPAVKGAAGAARKLCCTNNGAPNEGGPSKLALLLLVLALLARPGHDEWPEVGEQPEQATPVCGPQSRTKSAQVAGATASHSWPTQAAR